MKVFDLIVKIEECDLRKIEEDAQQAMENKEEQNALSAAGGATNADDGGGDGSADEAAAEENLEGLAADLANQMNLVIADKVKEKVNAVSAAILNKLGPDAKAAGGPEEGGSAGGAAAGAGGAGGTADGADGAAGGA